MEKEICRYGIMSNDKKYIKCKKCDSICVYSRYCTACGKVVMVDDYVNKCKMTCSKTYNKKGENKVENNTIKKVEDVENVETIKEENIEKDSIVAKPKKNKKEKIKSETCEIIKQGKDYIVVKFQGVNFKFNTTKEFKKNKIEVEYTSELGKKDFTIELK